MLIQRCAKHYNFVMHFGTAFASRYNMPAGPLPHRNSQCLINAATGKVPLCHDVDMPKANLRVLKSPDGPFHKGECSVCGEKFAVSPGAGPDFKREMLEVFDSHLQARHPRHDPHR